MWKYIGEEPKILSSMLQSPSTDELLKQVSKRWKAVYLVAHGSSYNATVVLADFISRHTGLRAYCTTPGTFITNLFALRLEEKNDILIIAISQTGSSSGVVAAATLARSEGFFVLGISSEHFSPLASVCHACLFLECGEEKSNAKTKGYSATLLALILFSIKYGCNCGYLSESNYKKIVRELEAMIGKIEEVTQKMISWCFESNFGSNCAQMYFLGYSMNYGTAMEGQLKLMETMCIPTMFNEIQEFSHGMHRSISDHSHIVLFNSRHTLSELTLDTSNYLLEKNSNVLVLNSNGRRFHQRHIVNLDEFFETQSVLLHTVAVQILAAALPEINGLDPNRSSNEDYTQIALTRLVDQKTQ